MRTLSQVLGLSILAVAATRSPAWAQGGTAAVPTETIAPADVRMDVVALTEFGTLGRVRGALPVNDRALVELFVTLPEHSGRSSYGFYGIRACAFVIAYSEYRRNWAFTAGQDRNTPMSLKYSGCGPGRRNPL